MKSYACLVSVPLSLFLVLPALAQGGKAPAPPPQPTVVTVPMTVPSLAPAPETKTTQTKGGVRITAETDEFTADVVPVRIDTQFEPGFKEMFKYHCTPGQPIAYFEHSYKPEVVSKPRNLIIHLKIDNQMPRVFRGAGALVQFNVAGKAIHVNPEGYGDFINAIVPPRSSQSVDIVGPEIASLPPQATIGVFLYDVVTKMDAAGNITEKQDFEWYYSLQSQSVTKEVTMPATTKTCGNIP